MKTKITILLLLAAVVCSCTSTRYLPSSATIDTNQYGSYILLTVKPYSTLSGELISIDTSNIVILSEKEKKCRVIPLSQVRHFDLRYANSTHYGWTIPSYLLLCISHGFYALITAPINLAVTISVTTSGERAFKYNNKNMTFDKLRMFARYPQGIPGNVDMASIR